MSLFGINRSILYVEKEKHDLELATTKEAIRSHVTNVSILMENLHKESIRIYGFLYFENHYVLKLREAVDANLEGKLMLEEAIKTLNLPYRVMFDPK